MKLLFLDNETSDTKQEKKRNPSPYLPDNKLISVGYQLYENGEFGELVYDFFSKNAPEKAKRLQAALDQTDCIVAFNAKFDISWLLEAGFKYDGNIYDPMIAEYVMARGQKWELSLDACADRHHLPLKKSDKIKEYWDQGLTFAEMPEEDVQEYGIQDIEVLKALYFKQMELLKLPENNGLIKTIKMSNEFIWCLIDMERNGIKIDTKALDEVDRQFTEEYNTLEKDLERITYEAMGDTPINLASHEQLSWVVYSRKVTDKVEWARIFNIGTEIRGAVKKPKRRPWMSSQEFVDYVRRYTTPIKRTRANHCGTCGGSGLVHRTRVDGTAFKKATKCKDCAGAGFTLEDLPAVAGLRCIPRSSKYVADGGFATDRETLEELSLTASGVAKEFLTKIIRYNAIATYRETFIGGIRRGLGNDWFLHTQLMQAITATGRLSSQNPNFQNMPRANTFPVRKVVISRWADGEIIEVDFSKLEYVIAVFLAQDIAGYNDVMNGVDAHKLTASIIECSRQDAKPHTFKPLFFGQSGTEKEKEYYQWFKDKHVQITQWQLSNFEQVLKTGKLVLPTGREYVFRGTKRTASGYITNSTQMANYPVQGFATGDIVPVTIIALREALRKLAHLKTKMVLTVHDSIVFDVFPGEREHILKLIRDVFSQVPQLLKIRYNILFNVPLGWETKGGPNWLNMKELDKDDGKAYITGEPIRARHFELQKSVA